jgi:hypothetical protein
LDNPGLKWVLHDFIFFCCDHKDDCISDFSVI